jgi:leucyl/phenylalanyl-tRNA---protein transferase
MRDDEPFEIRPEHLLRAYAAGIFPMAETAGSDEIFWVDPERRGIIPLDGLHVPRRLARSFRTRTFEIRTDHAFHAVLAACADRGETWISGRIARLYGELHRLGHAHSVEIWIGGQLAGGLYGVSLGAAFFGESMFSRERDASKLALIALVARLNAGGYRLLDTQFVTEHLHTLGAREIPRLAYRRLLRAAIQQAADFDALPASTSRQELLQLCTQTS